MELPTSDLELLQSVIDNRLGGDIESAARRLEYIERELAVRGMPMYEKVGNNCLVFYTNDAVKKICDENPENIQGVIVNDYDCWIHPDAVVVGSFLRGDSVEFPAVVDFGSKVYYSDVVMAHLRRSEVNRSYVSIGKISDSVIDESFTSGNLRNMNLVRSMARIGTVSEVTATGQLLGYGRGRDEPDTDGLVARMLARQGLYLPAIL